MARLRRLEGLEAVQRVFSNVPREIQERITDAINRGADEIAATARTLVPVRTGELRGAIRVQRPGAVRRGLAGASLAAAAAGANAIEARIGVFLESAPSPGFYARWVEFGTAARVKGNLIVRAGRRRRFYNTHPGSKPEPFLFPAYFVNRRRVLNRIKRSITMAVRSAVAKESGSI
jgi:hypothetical protein